MSELRFERLIERARRTVRIRDKAYRQERFAGAADLPAGALLQSVLSALRAGMNGQDWDSVAEGFVMLQDFVGAMRTP